MKLLKIYFQPSAIRARIIGDLSLLLAMIAAYIDVIIPIVTQYQFGSYIEQNKGWIMFALITIKFLTNFSKKNG